MPAPCPKCGQIEDHDTGCFPEPEQKVVTVPADAKWFVTEKELPPLSRAIRFALTIAPKGTADTKEWERMLSDIKSHMK